MQEVNYNEEDLHFLSSEEDINNVVSFIEKQFVVDTDSKKVSENFVKLSEFLNKNNIIIGELESERLLDKCEKLRNSLYSMYLAQALTRVSRFSNLINLVDLYCVRNGYEQENDIDALYDEKGSDLDLLKVYLNEIGQFKLLTREEEIELANMGEEGRSKLVEHNLRLGVSIAKKYRGQGVDFTDLIQGANEGIMSAARKFDASKGCKFSTYATWWAKQGVQREIANNSRNIKVPAEVHDNIIKIKKVTEQYMKDNNGKTPSEEELCSLLNINKDNLQIALKYMNSIVSLSTPLQNGEDNDSTFGDFIEDEYFQIDKEIDNYFYEGFYDLFINCPYINDREREILKYRYGFYGKAHNYDEISKIIKVSRERIRQIEKAAIRKLRFDPRIKEYAGFEMRFGILKK